MENVYFWSPEQHRIWKYAIFWWWHCFRLMTLAAQHFCGIVVIQYSEWYVRYLKISHFLVFQMLLCYFWWLDNWVITFNHTTMSFTEKQHLHAWIFNKFEKYVKEKCKWDDIKRQKYWKSVGLIMPAATYLGKIWFSFWQITYHQRVRARWRFCSLFNLFILSTETFAHGKWNSAIWNR